MSELDLAKGYIVDGDKESAKAVLASMLIKNKNQLEAWLLLGDLVDDPSRKKQCYRWALKLSPQNSHALTKLQELEEPPLAEVPVAVPGGSQIEASSSARDTRQRITPVPSFNFYSPVEHSNAGVGIIGYVIGGIAAFLLLLYVIANPGNFSNSTKILYLGLIFIGLIAFVIILSVSGKNRR